MGTPTLSARGRLWAPAAAGGELRAAGRGSGKLAARERDEGEDEEGEARPLASWSPLRAPGLGGRRRSRSWREDAGASGTAMRLCSGSAPAAGGAASPPVSHGDRSAADQDRGVQPEQPSASPTGRGCCGLALQGRPAAARIIPCAELPIRRRVHGGVEVELLGLLEGCFVPLGEHTSKGSGCLSRDRGEDVRSGRCRSWWACAGLPAADNPVQTWTRTRSPPAMPLIRSAGGFEAVGKPSFTCKLPLHSAHQPISADSMPVRGLVTDIWRQSAFSPNVGRGGGGVGNQNTRDALLKAPSQLPKPPGQIFAIWRPVKL